MELALEPQTPAPALQVVAQAPAALTIPDDSPAAITLKALAAGVSIADMREMMAMQREWAADKARAAFYQALAGFKAEAIEVLKTKKVDFTPSGKARVFYKHASLAAVVDAVGPALSRHGLGFRWDVSQARDWINVRCILTHRDGHSEFVEMGGPPDATGNKNSLQQVASATSYLQRYTLKAITGVAEADDPDDDDAGAGRTNATGGTGATGAGRDAPPPWVDGSDAQQQQQQRDGRKPYPAEDFERNLVSWQRAIKAGKKTADEVIATVETKGFLTEDQKAEIRRSPKE